MISEPSNLARVLRSDTTNWALSARFSCEHWYLWRDSYPPVNTFTSAPRGSFSGEATKPIGSCS